MMYDIGESYLWCHNPEGSMSPSETIYTMLPGNMVRVDSHNLMNGHRRSEIVPMGDITKTRLASAELIRNDKGAIKKLQAGIKIGDVISVIQPEECSYSNYAGNPEKIFMPGDKAVVESIMIAKVSMRKNEKGKVSEYLVKAKPVTFDWPDYIRVGYENIIFIKR